MFEDNWLIDNPTLKPGEKAASMAPAEKRSSRNGCIKTRIKNVTIASETYLPI